MPPKDEVETVIQALRRYTSDNPHACDTPDGIARWWLQGRHAGGLVALALERMGAEGLLERRPAADGRVRYRLPMPAAEPVPSPTAVAAETGPTLPQRNGAR
ncbi:hypothetical protein [Rubrivivax rivuli]|uniref:MarR family transcriptional regulator n=1 Tax=Rubrivivax rivuli TaxID=1862385 RepID=A0A437RHJ7_9BURK|nr:hypothetical protein [Rubrivivax rivuli]RVU46209.1 hypothetical protein EOE66_10150 [Rubrivivax rivuli]